VADDVHTRWLTCPRCLAEIAGPAAVQAEAPPRPTEQAAAESPPTCTRCGREVQPGWRTCPFCEAPLRGRRPARPAGLLDDEARRDRTGATVVAAVLGALLLVGTVAFFAMGGAQLTAASEAGPGILAAGVLLLLALGVGVVVLVYTSRSRTSSTIGGVLGGVGMGLGAVVLYILLACAAVASALSNVGSTCGAGANTGPPSRSPR
jgi:hypothetical protein